MTGRAPPEDRPVRGLRGGQDKAGAGCRGSRPAGLWCESHGMTAERMKHLAMAVLYDPSNVLARGLMGLVAFNGKWERPDDVSREARDDPNRKALMQEYLQRRAKTPDTADGHWKLAAWCEQNGLKPAGRRPLPAVVCGWTRGGTRRGSIWDSRSRAGRWIKPEVVAAAKARAQEQQRANKHWRPILERYRSRLAEQGSGRGGPRPSRIWRRSPIATRCRWSGRSSAGRGGAAEGGRAGAGPDRRRRRPRGALVLLAVFSGSAEVRRRGGRDAPSPRRARVRRDADRHDPRADRVRGQEGARAGAGGRAADQGPGLGART